MGASDGAKLVICCGCPLSVIRKFSLVSPLSTSPSWFVTTASTFTRLDSTDMEVCGAVACACFCGACGWPLGATGGAGCSASGADCGPFCCRAKAARVFGGMPSTAISVPSNIALSHLFSSMFNLHQPKSHAARDVIVTCSAENSASIAQPPQFAMIV